MSRRDLEAMFSEAIRLGDLQAEQLAAASLEIRRLRRILWRTFGCLRSGRTDEARKVIEAEIGHARR